MNRLIALAALLAVGCAMQTSRKSESGLPADSTRHLGKVWRDPGNRFVGYDLLYVAPVKSRINSRARDVGPVANAAIILRMNLVAELSRTGVFRKVTTTGQATNSVKRVLRLDSVFEDVQRGTVMRDIFGYGAGSPRLEVRSNFVDQQTGRVICEVNRATHGFSYATWDHGALMTDSEILEEGTQRYASKLARYIEDVSREEQLAR